MAPGSSSLMRLSPAWSMASGSSPPRCSAHAFVEASRWHTFMGVNDDTDLSCGAELRDRPAFEAHLVAFLEAREEAECAWALNEMAACLLRMPWSERLRSCATCTQRAILNKRKASQCNKRVRGAECARWSLRVHRRAMYILSACASSPITSRLPSALLVHILSLLPLRSLGLAASVCHLLDDVSSHNSLWRPLYLARFPMTREQAASQRALHAATRPLQWLSTTQIALDPRAAGSQSQAQPESHERRGTHDTRDTHAEGSRRQEPPSSSVNGAPDEESKSEQDFSVFLRDFAARQAAPQANTRADRRAQRERRAQLRQRRRRFKMGFHRRLLDPWVGDKVEVSWKGRFRLEAMEVYQGQAWWEAVVVEKEFPGDVIDDVVIMYNDVVHNACDDDIDDSVMGGGGYASNALSPLAAAFPDSVTATHVDKLFDDDDGDGDAYADNNDADSDGAMFVCDDVLDDAQGLTAAAAGHVTGSFQDMYGTPPRRARATRREPCSAPGRLDGVRTGNPANSMALSSPLFQGRILSTRYKIHYPGWVSRWDEWVHRRRLRWAPSIDLSARLRVHDPVEVWCCGSNVPGAWLEAVVHKIRGERYDVGKVLSNGSLVVDRSRLRLVKRTSYEKHARSLQLPAFMGPLKQAVAGPAEGMRRRAQSFGDGLSARRRSLSASLSSSLPASFDRLSQPLTSRRRSGSSRFFRGHSPVADVVDSEAQADDEPMRRQQARQASSRADAATEDFPVGPRHERVDDEDMHHRGDNDDEHSYTYTFHHRGPGELGHQSTLTDARSSSRATHGNRTHNQRGRRQQAAFPRTLRTPPSNQVEGDGQALTAEPGTVSVTTRQTDVLHRWPQGGRSDDSANGCAVM